MRKRDLQYIHQAIAGMVYILYLHIRIEIEMFFFAFSRNTFFVFHPQLAFKIIWVPTKFRANAIREILGNFCDIR